MSADVDDLQGRLSELPDASRRWVRELLDEHTMLKQKAKGRDELHQAIADLHTKCLELHESELEAQVHLGNLYASTEQLTSTVFRNEVLAGIQEIVANLIGSEQVGIFERDASSSELILAQQIGLDPSLYDKLIADGGVIAAVAESGECFYRDATTNPSGEAGELTACVPLRAGDGTIGTLAIFALLPQKPKLTQTDISLLELLSGLAGHALYCTHLQSERDEADEKA